MSLYISFSGFLEKAERDGVSQTLMEESEREGDTRNANEELRRKMKEEGNTEGMKEQELMPQDDKVGAALSMTYVTGQPILFVGCGQTYTDLRHLRVNHIVQALLS